MNPILVLIMSLLAYSATSQNNPVIVELFTSQGCSSCPAADDNLKQIVDQAEAKGLPVYGLSFHVDYWNYIGWKDPYSSKEFTARQKMYAQQLNLETIYTPQMIVNGNFEFVGSNRGDAKKFIEKALAEQNEFKISISNLKLAGNDIQIEYQLSSRPTSEKLNVALVARRVKNFVSRGENNGRTLEHSNVVINFQTGVAEQKGMITIPKSSKIEPMQMIVLFLSDSKGKVKGSIGKEL